MQVESKKSKFSITLAMILLASSSLIAQEQKDTKELDSVTVVADENSDYQNEKKVNLNRTGIDIENTAKSIQIFNTDFIEDAQLQNIENIITMSSNTVYTGDNHGRTNEISMRGFSDVPILIDGLKVTNKMAHPEVYNFESIEIQKGPDSLQYGESSPGGIVNLVKKKPLKETLGKIELEVSDNSSYSPKLDLAGSLNEDKSLYFRLVSVLKYDEGWTNSNTDTNKIFVAPSLSYDINDNHTLTFMAEYTKETTPSSFGTYVNSKGDLVAPIKNTISNPDEEFEKTQKIVGFDLDTTFDTFNSNFKYRYIDYVGDNGNVHMPLMYNETTNNLTRAFATQKQEFEEHALQYTLNKEFYISTFKNNISIGADYNKAYSKLDMLYDPYTPYTINLSNPTYEHLTNASEHPSVIDYSSEKTYVESWGTFLQDNINLTDNLIFSAGVRYSESKPKDGQRSDALTPSFGLIYHLSDQTSIYTNYSESFTPNSYEDIKGNILDPETGKGYELGVKQKLFDDNFNLTAAIFKIEKENIAELDSEDLTNTKYKASGKQESQGFELDINGNITPNWSVIASYGFTNTKNKDNKNLDLKNIPEHTANIFTTYYLASFGLPNIYIGGGAKYLGSRYANDDNTIKLDSEIIYNATVGYKKGHWRANLSVQNLTDEEYVDGVLTSNARGTRVYVGTPRTVLATISYSF